MASGNTKQPIGLGLLFVTEMWERFSYYGMRALLVLFLITPESQGGFGWTAAAASKLYAWYTGLVYLTPIIGGYLADRYLGTQRAMLIGGSVIALGHFSLALENQTGFYLGLLLVILGTGLFKPNVSTQVGQLYCTHDPRRDAGFTLFYMGINLGALLGPLICGYLGQNPQYGWRYGFGAAGVGMTLGLLVYLGGRKKFLAGVGPQSVKSLDQAYYHSEVTGANPLTTAERQRLLAILIMAFFVIFFWLAFEQAGSSMTIFAERNTDRALPGWLQSWLGMAEIPSAWFQTVNPAAILLFAPVFSLVWQHLGKLDREPSTPLKMALGLGLMGSGFLVLVCGAYRSDQGILVSPLWLVAAYLLQTWGELCLSPVGLSLVTRLAPVKYAALIVGVWFLANFAANLIGGYLASSLEAVQRGEIFHILGGQADFFLMFVVSSWSAGLLLLWLVPMVKRLIQ